MKDRHVSQAFAEIEQQARMLAPGSSLTHPIVPAQEMTLV
jgi:hypothetical protein